MSVSTTYRDEITLPAGCYTLTVEDDGGDGLDFWYWAAVGQNVGTGNLSLRRQLTQTFFAAVKSFNPDFGGDLHYDFIIPQAVGTEEELENPRRFSLYPNPARESTTLELTGFSGEQVEWQIMDMTGRIFQTGQTIVGSSEQLEQLDTRSLPAGMYIVRVQLDGKVYSKELVVMP